MLTSLRNDVQANSKKIADINFELNEKLKKFTTNESKLSEPVPPADSINSLENYLVQLRQNVSDLEKRCISEADPKKEDKLTIF